MAEKVWQKRLIRLFRDLFLFLVLLSVIEWWQARNLVKGQLPVDLNSLTELVESSPEDPITAFDSDATSKARYTLLYVFAPWCGVCRLSAPNLVRLQNLDIKVQALALSWSAQSEVQSFVASSGLKVPVLLGFEKEEELLRITAYPSHFLLDPQGKIIKSWAGYTTTPGFYWKIFWNRFIDAVSS